MTNTRKILALLVAALLVLGMSATALAGTITVENAKAGKTYDLYRIFDATVSDDGSSAAYTLTSTWNAFFVGTSAPGRTYLKDAEGANTFPVVVNGATKYLELYDGNMEAFAKAALAWAANKNADKTVTATADGDLQIDNLPLGYYMMYPQGATDIKDGNVSIVSLDTTTPDATVVIKADYPGEGPTPFDKEADGADNTVSADIGKEITFTLSGKVPDTTGYSKYNYIVTDSMTEGLTFNNSYLSGLTVTFGGSPISTGSNYTRQATRGGTVITGTVNNTTVMDGFKLTFDMTKYQNYVGQDIVITYKAVLNEKALQGDVATNDASLFYSNDPQNPNETEEFEPDPDDPPFVEVTTNSVKVIKTDDSGNPLAGAKFVLKKGNTFYKWTAASGNTPAKVEWVTAQAQATELETLDDGIVTFAGIADGTYVLEETEAPSGYNKLSSTISVTVAAQDDPNNGGKVGQVHEETIENKSGSILPSTGGIGTTIFYAAGSLLLIGAAVLLITRRRMRTER